jgi:uncharacterized lipoprotein YehR (DUF1307 family)
MGDMLMKNINKIFSILLITVSIMSLVGCGEKANKEETNNKVQTTDNQKNNEEKESSKEEIKEVELIKDAVKTRNEWQKGMVYIDATVKNNSEKVLKQLVLTVNFTNKNKEVINSVDYTLDIDVSSKTEQTVSVEIPNGQEYYGFDVDMKNYKVE